MSKINYKDLSEAEALDMIGSWCHLWSLADSLREAWNEEVYQIVDRYIDQYWYN